jgi:lipoprotein-anchoring transpeptidase ErfK/SrfK
MTRLIPTLIAACAVSMMFPADIRAQNRSRATQTTQEVINGLSVEREDYPVMRTPEDGDDIITDPVQVRAVKSYGALGHDASNSVGVRPGAIIIDTSARRLYFGLDDGRMRVYPVAVGKSGAQWRGSATIGRKAVNPTWRPTARQRRLKRLPSVVRPGPANPLGVRALYLSRGGRETLYRIHGTNAPGSIGKAVSSGCIRMRNADVIDLYERVDIGASVSVR